MSCNWAGLKVVNVEELGVKTGVEGGLAICGRTHSQVFMGMQITHKRKMGIHTGMEGVRRLGRLAKQRGLVVGVDDVSALETEDELVLATAWKRAQPIDHAMRKAKTVQEQKSNDRKGTFERPLGSAWTWVRRGRGNRRTSRRRRT